MRTLYTTMFVTEESNNPVKVIQNPKYLLKNEHLVESALFPLDGTDAEILYKAMFNTAIVLMVASGVEEYTEKDVYKFILEAMKVGAPKIWTPKKNSAQILNFLEDESGRRVLLVFPHYRTAVKTFDSIIKDYRPDAKIVRCGDRARFQLENGSYLEAVAMGDPETRFCGYRAQWVITDLPLDSDSVREFLLPMVASKQPDDTTERGVFHYESSL